MKQTFENIRRRIVIETLDFGGNPDPKSAQRALAEALRIMANRVEKYETDVRLFDVFGIDLEQSGWNMKFVIKLEQSEFSNEDVRECT